MAIKGNLKDLSLVDIIQLNCRSGELAELSLTRDGTQGVVYFAEGQVVHVAYENDTGEEALYHLLRWPDGDFVIEKGVACDARTVDLPWTALLMRGLKRVDEERGLEAQQDEPGQNADILRELAERIDGFVAACVAGPGEGPRAHWVVEEAFDVQGACDSMLRMVGQVTESLARIEAGSFVETITLTSHYCFITRPVADGAVSIQVVLDAQGNVGAARMYLAAYLATRSAELLPSEAEKGVRL
jgi:hypothetical protein